MKNHLEKFSLVLGFLFIVLIALHIPLRPPFYLEDACAPFMALILCLRGNFLRYWQDSVDRALLLCLGWMLLATFLHLLLGTGENGYNTLVFCYLGMIFLFFRHTAFPKSVLWKTGAIIAGLVFLGWIPEILRLCGWHALPETGLCLITANTSGTAMDFLHRRYAFTFGNPNLLGAFCPLLMLLLATGLSSTDNKENPSKRKKVLLWCCAGLLLLPLCHTFSKHAIISLMIFLGTGCLAFLPRASSFSRRLSKTGLWGTLLLLAIVCEMTVLWVTFPLQKKSPFIHTAPGAYTIHQKAYLKMIFQRPFQALTGRSIGEIRQEYPRQAEPERARKILKEYNAMQVYDGYCSFMDPHNEYLNQAAFFGLPVLLLWGFFLLQIGKAAIDDRQTILLFLVSLAICCLWDDLFSKRFIWVALALCCRHLPSCQKERATAILQ